MIGTSVIKQHVQTGLFIKAKNAKHRIAHNITLSFTPPPTADLQKKRNN